MNDQLAEKIAELYHNTPDNVVAVSYGHKLVDGQDTGDLAVIFHVKQKLPLNKVSPADVLPNTIELNGVTYLADVQENDFQVELVSNCYQTGDSSSAGYRGGYRPLQGGTSLSDTDPSSYSAGTLGGLFLDTTDNTVVGLTCSHVVVDDYSLNINKPNNSATFAADCASEVIYQPGTLDGGLSLGYDLGAIGFVKRYYVARTDGSSNNMDIGIVGIRGDSAASPLVNADSRKPYGANFVPVIATTTEINSLLTSPKPILEKYARSSGGTGGTACPIYATNLGAILSLYIPVQNTYQVAYYYNTIVFRYANTDANGKVYGNVLTAGDSGALLIGDFNGVKKIVGVCFATANSGSENANSYGIACRMDMIASEMKITNWDGVSGKYSDASKRKTITTPGRGYDKTIVSGGKTYWQIGTAANASSTLDDKWMTFEPDPYVLPSGATIKNTSKISKGVSSASKFIFNGQTIYQS